MESREKLEAIANPKFAQWQAHIDFCLRERSREVHVEELAKTIDFVTYFDIDRYQCAQYREVYDASRDHAATHNQELSGLPLIVLVHPFYLPLSHARFIRTEDEAQVAARYLDNIFELIEVNAHDRVADIVVFETAHHYARGTSTLLENGLVNRVLFTQFDRGVLMERDEVCVLQGERAYLAGGYAGRCLSDVAHSLRQVFSNADIHPVGDACVTSPRAEGLRVNPAIDVHGLLTLRSKISSKKLLDMVKSPAQGMQQAS